MAYYLPINSTSLPHYFACACVKPARYFENKPQDIQDRFRNALLISSELGTKDTDCCIELVLTKDEETSLIPCGKSFYLLSTPLPISRVKKVYFENQRQLDQTLSNINMSAAFIPHSLASVTRFSNVAFEDGHEDDKLSVNDYSHQIKMFDRILGALALMKTAREPYMNYSENYASTLSFFNAIVRDNLKRQGHQINEKFFGLFSRTGSFLKFIPYLEKKISKEDLDQIAAENNQRIERSITKAINYDKLSGITYAFAILQSYGVGGEAATKKIDALISTNFEGLKDNKAEGIALYYGYNRGYSVFNNSYGTKETERQTVKYLLNSKLDYYTIESVYQFAFNAKTASTEFSYIDAWCPKQQQHPKRKTDYMVFDIVFVGKKKPSVFSKEYLLRFLDEIKTFDFLNSPIASLIELIRDRVANDTKEEIEDISVTKIADTDAKWSAKYNEALAVIDSLKGEIASQDSIITDLQKQNESLVKEIALLKSTTGQYSSKVVETAGLLQEPEVEYGSKPSDGAQDDLPGQDKPSIVDDYTLGKKGRKAAYGKSGTTKHKSASKASKKAANKPSEDIIDKTATEDQAFAQDFMTKPSADNSKNTTLFD